jgi:hypothetical protein
VSHPHVFGPYQILQKGHCYLQICQTYLLQALLQWVTLAFLHVLVLLHYHKVIHLQASGLALHQYDL